MHELSIANSLLDVVTAQLIESGAGRVRRVIIEVGDLSGVVPAALRTAFRAAATHDVSFAGAVLDIRPVAVTLYCDPCGAERPAVSAAAMRCAVCGRASARVVRGRELDVVGIEVTDEIFHEATDAAPDA
ncbi:MAG TPA: hydrogenase maturation nickel metallochaperone HypA [Tepidisphaeraceae bacterium]|jgi:hydrogenase nickel incorporation protein HypA/HybF